MKVSIIVAVYKDVEALRLIVKALQTQTYKNFELIVAEDGASKEMKEFIASVKGLDIKHTTQEDKGVRKARSQNNAILASTGEYLIFIDGDCLPYSSFIAGHVALCEPCTLLSGRRVNIPAELSASLRSERISSLEIEKNYFSYISLLFDKNVRYKQGVYFNPEGVLFKLLSKRDISTSILGCNFSCFKKDMIAINGFDESYGETAIPDDVDLEWRFSALGLRFKSCKNIANMLHLDHRAHDRGDASSLLALMHKRKEANEFVCQLGLNTHE
jgi:glycosyltransferase involved in cell wall biosynthesis